MTNPSDLYASTLSTLYQTKLTLLSDAWHDSLASPTTTKQQRIDSSVKLVETSNAITTLANTQLSAILPQMTAQESALTSAINGVNAAVKNLQEVQTVLDAVTKIIGVVAKIVPLL